MNAAEEDPFQVVRSEDELLRLQLRIAQRADELAGPGQPRPRSEDFAFWLQAEREVLEARGERTERRRGDSARS